MYKYEKLELEFNNVPVYAIKYTEGPYAGIIFCYWGVRFEEDKQNEQLILHYEYDVIEGTVSNTEDFEQTIGNLLVQMIEEANAKQEPLVYTGGIDEVGTKDSGAVGL